MQEGAKKNTLAECLPMEYRLVRGIVCSEEITYIIV